MNKTEKEEKSWPSSEIAEQAVLGCILTGGEREQEIGLAWIRDENAFYFDDNKKVWNAFRELYKDNIEIDFVTVTDKIKDNTGESMAYYITGLAESVPTTANVQHYARIVWEKYIQRETAKSAQKLVNASYENYKEVDSILENHSKLITELREIQPSKQKNIEDLVDEMIDVVKEDSNLIPFNLAHLDMFAGGMTRKEITVLGGRPGHGKTTLVINMIQGLIKQGFTVMLFNREIAKHKPDVVIDDYIQLINVHNVKEGRRFEIEKIMQEYKWICKTENCSAILVSQLNREIEKRLDPRPRMSDYSESGVIEQTAESAMFVYYGYNFDSERYDPYKSEIIVSKSRYGKIGTHKVGFNGNRCKFYINSDMAQKDSPKNGV